MTTHKHMQKDNPNTGRDTQKISYTHSDKDTETQIFETLVLSFTILPLMNDVITSLSHTETLTLSLCFLPFSVHVIFIQFILFFKQLFNSSELNNKQKGFGGKYFVLCLFSYLANVLLPKQLNRFRYSSGR